jgi:hypothetical protein
MPAKPLSHRDLLAEIFDTNRTTPDSLTKAEINRLYEASSTLLDLAGNYSCFGSDAAKAEKAFGVIFGILTRSKVKSRTQPRSKSTRK